MMLLDGFAPDPHFVERHRIEVRATPEVAYRAISTTDFGTSAPIKLLLLLRSLPGRMLSPGTTPRRDGALTLQTIVDAGFGWLAETPGREIVLGVAGRFWRPVGNVEPFRPEYFTGALPPGLAKAVWNFAVHPGDPVVVTTETRIVCADRASRLKFGLYWRLIRPFSGLIRIIMLRAIRRTCEGAA